ncbi:hypothetical protein D9542_09000 [Corynebacterium macginleyi]|nr:hypothetical protein D9542_09000 [Corynebacterium macginleyi]
MRGLHRWRFFNFETEFNGEEIPDRTDKPNKAVGLKCRYRKQAKKMEADGVANQEAEKQHQIDAARPNPLDKK